MTSLPADDNDQIDSSTVTDAYRKGTISEDQDLAAPKMSQKEGECEALSLALSKHG